MDALELKVPPPLVALVAALGMWVISRLTSESLHFVEPEQP